MKDTRFNQLAKQYRQDLGLTQLEFAKRFKMSNSAVSRYESNDRPVPHNVLAAILLYDDVTRVELIDYRNDSKTFGRAFVAYGVKPDLSLQDQGRTLKIFVKPLDS